MKSLDYYDQNAQDFVAQTLLVDMTEHYRRFLAGIANGSRILDAGSGSGRDAAYFSNAGYEVEAFDASIEMVASTRQNAGVPTKLMTFEAFEWEQPFDGIWACASLLHVRRQKLPKVLMRLTAALNANGLIYASFKLGAHEREVGGRYFNDVNKQQLEQVIRPGIGLEIEAVWTSADVRPERRSEAWLNCLLRKKITAHVR